MLLTNRSKNLYQEVILDHNKSPRNYRAIDFPTHFAKGHNPLCGDKLDVYLIVDGEDVVQDVSFVGDGCAISKASASIMTTIVKGKSVDEAKELFTGFHEMATGKIEPSEDPKLRRLQVFAGVKDLPARVKCATLAWHTLDAALRNKQEISTE
ncbi:MAG: SUF system NifU family Fe-S cluster assembly protein [Candidatus Cyclonatronum sp.]|uniref:Fe-S cluster assembly sulfur transfer protein SufU n=1 Tax=Cyclonatronum sp. TaxID=3024185 RepID=UPI0025C2848A|nr:SUF system NifU family Fe-S cluster assembly protein [Cyclonatronum sp.]MCH8485801.1 SUF system NifU family Fe-S cluster assembly protein [Cyclonatronum sp.]